MAAPHRHPRLLPARSARAALAAVATMTAAATLVAGSPTSTQAHHADPPGPVNAQSTYKWGKPTWQDEWEGRRTGPYRAEGPGLVRTQHGMLTLNTTEDPMGGTVTATRRTRGYVTGRWEIRLRSKRFETGAADYTVRTELIPAGRREQHCGAQDIALQSYRQGDPDADMWVRTLPNQEFTASEQLDLADDQWHTFGVEVTESSVTWFVDAHAVRRDRRAESLSGVPLTVRFSMVATPGLRMNPSRMQMDWLRYFVLDRPNALPTDAPRLTRGTYAGAC